jgi:hypothetical protein
VPIACFERELQREANKELVYELQREANKGFSGFSQSKLEKRGIQEQLLGTCRIHELK